MRRVLWLLALMVAGWVSALAGSRVDGSPTDGSPKDGSLMGDVTLQKFLGRWEGEGTLFGQAGEFSMNWEPAVGDRFLRLTFQNPVLQAEAFYHQTDDGLNGTWFDSRGVQVPLTGTIDDSVVEVNWGSQDTEQGRTRYHLVNENEMHVTDHVLKAGEWHPFAEASYRRVPSPLDHFAWLIGAWDRETEKSLTRESWNRLAPGILVGESARTSKASGEVVFREEILLVEMQSDVFYIPKVDENADPVPFKLVEAEGDRFVFENPKHDFPQRIVYERTGEGSMTATVSEMSEDGNRIEFQFQRKD